MCTALLDMEGDVPAEYYEAVEGSVGGRIFGPMGGSGSMGTVDPAMFNY